MTLPPPLSLSYWLWLCWLWPGLPLPSRERLAAVQLVLEKVEALNEAEKDVSLASLRGDFAAAVDFALDAQVGPQLYRKARL